MAKADTITWEELDRAMREELKANAVLKGDNYVKHLFTGLRTRLPGWKWTPRQFGWLEALSSETKKISYYDSSRSK